MSLIFLIFLSILRVKVQSLLYQFLDFFFQYFFYELSLFQPKS